jgi:hypothetical protein
VLDAAGLATHRYRWSREETLERLAAWAREHGRPPTLADARDDPRLPGKDTCTRHFGSWNRALHEAGLTPEHHARWDDHDIHAILREGQLAYSGGGEDLDARFCSSSPSCCATAAM